VSPSCHLDAGHRRGAPVQSKIQNRKSKILPPPERTGPKQPRPLPPTRRASRDRPSNLNCAHPPDVQCSDWIEACWLVAVGPTCRVICSQFYCVYALQFVYRPQKHRRSLAQGPRLPQYMCHPQSRRECPEARH